MKIIAVLFLFSLAACGAVGGPTPEATTQGALNDDEIVTFTQVKFDEQTREPIILRRDSMTRAERRAQLASQATTMATSNDGVGHVEQPLVQYVACNPMLSPVLVNDSSTGGGSNTICFDTDGMSGGYPFCGISYGAGFWCDSSVPPTYSHAQYVTAGPVYTGSIDTSGANVCMFSNGNDCAAPANVYWNVIHLN